MASFNSFFPANYPYMVPQQSQPVMNPQPQQQNNMIWVQGEAGMKAFLVAPNTTVQLWDSENPVIYLKSADASGMPSVKILDYSIRDTAPKPQNNVAGATPQQMDLSQYVTKKELDEIVSQLRGEHRNESALPAITEPATF